MLCDHLEGWDREGGREMQEGGDKKGKKKMECFRKINLATKRKTYFLSSKS